MKEEAVVGVPLKEKQMNDGETNEDVEEEGR